MNLLKYFSPVCVLGWVGFLFVLILLALISLQFPIHFVSFSDFWSGDGTLFVCLFFSTIILYK